MIAHTIQLALAPVFLLVAIGNILNILSTRLGRVVDRARTLQELHKTTEGAEHDVVVAQIRAVDRRIKLVTSAIRLLVISGIAIGLTVAILFFEQMTETSLEGVAAAIFLIAIALLMWALTLFLRETRIAAETLRIPRALLELDRKL
ncbi:hypothetical protein GCM10011371_22260 [Novosphingobium marinum]|uniref:DUF2721 domain-containing protein n=1 Tax=Novosphingobium marinum TaxID=1514948 RepID=A0A7Y9XXP9_9SPHN|nr:DUF2721 domain-containing protein [Novosphingobium marinum]NYH96340.1 hypothetical protein [Novosphingobium marinum]GGC34479.1 hypothetical protein GCM10011371_22260 [Novosphingobium marinum]